MRIPDENLAEVFDRRFTVVEGFLDGEVFADEVAVTGPAGSVLLHRSGVLHRGGARVAC